MTRFAEDPLPAIIIGLCVLSMLLILYLQTRERSWFIAILCAAALTLVAVVWERVIVTERERVEGVIYGVAASAEADDMEAVLEFLAPNASRIRGLVNRYMPNSEVERARVIGSLKIEIDETAFPPTAVAQFNAFVHGRWERDKMPGAVRADVTARLERPDDRWLITEMDGIADR